MKVLKGNPQVREILNKLKEIERLQEEGKTQDETVRLMDLETEILEDLHQVKFDDDEVRYFFDHFDEEKSFRVGDVVIRIQSRLWMYCEPFKKHEQ